MPRCARRYIGRSVMSSPPRVTVPSSGRTDRKSTRLNSSHEWISYAVFCLKKKNKDTNERSQRATFHLITDHLMLRGPSCKHPKDTSDYDSTDQGKNQSAEARGKEKDRQQR